MSRLIGAYYEQLALDYLLSRSLILQDRNFSSRFGEIDLIMRDGVSTVFVEVRKRKSGIDAANWSITSAKQNKLVKTAQYYMLKIGRELNCRFDAILIDEQNNIEWLKNIIILY